MVQPELVLILPVWQETIYIYIYSVFIYITCLHRWPKINWNAPWLLCSSGLCAWPCTVHFVYNTTYKVSALSETTTLFATKCSQTTHNSITEFLKNYSDLVRGWKKTNSNLIIIWLNLFTSRNTLSTQPCNTQRQSLSNTDVRFVGIICNLGFIFSSDLSMKQHIKTCKVAQIRHKFHLPISHWRCNQDDSCILSRFYCCNTLLAGYPQCCQTTPRSAELCSQTRP